MAHPKRADEHVDLAAVLGIVEQQPLTALQRVELDSRLVAALRQQLRGGVAATLRDGEVDVLVFAVQRRWDDRRVEAHRDAAEQRERRAVAAGGVEHAPRLVDDVGEDRRHPM